MLRYLGIQNLAVIESAEIELEGGFTVATGETGAGKSMLVEAVGLLLGARATPELVRTGADRLVVQAVFETGSGAELIVRREVSAQGRSRAFVDGMVVTLAALREATAPLVELHGQHEHQTLLDPDSHLDWLDIFAGLEADRERVGQAYWRWRRLRDEMTTLQGNDREQTARLDLLRAQIAEVEEAAVRPGEEQELEGEERLLANAERVREVSETAYARLYDGEQAALVHLGAVWRHIAELAEVDARFVPHVQGGAGIKAQLEDLAFLLREVSESIDAAPARLEAIGERLQRLRQLARKHQTSVSGLNDRCEEWKRQAEAVEHSGESLRRLAESLEAAASEFCTLATTLSRTRQKAARKLQEELVGALADLAMERTRFEVRLETVPEAGEQWSPRGLDRAECYLSPNPGEALRPLARIASGGELSRIMLAMKSLAAAGSPGKALIFDEVDAGIGGRVADVVGRRLGVLGARGQVLCITHLPQVAAHGTHHVRITKTVRGGRTVTEVVLLGDADRVEELARMLGGSGVTDRARARAVEMREQAKGE